MPDSWERGPGATFRGGRNGLWLHFHRDAELAYTNDNSIPPRDARPDIGPVILQVRAGQQVRVVDSRAPDDGLGHEPTVRADFAEVRVSALGAAVQVYVLPPSDAMQRVYKRSADDLAFWKAMLAAPEDDLPRMVYADWLDERGDPAGPILRGAVPLTMYYSVSIGDRWEPRQVRPADWRVAVTELRTFVSQGGVYFLEDPGYARIALSQYTRTPQSAGRDAWHCMSVSLASGEPLPPFVNYLLVQTAFAEWIRLFHAPGRRPDAGEQPRLEIPDPTTDRRPAADEPAAPPPPAVGQIWLVGTTLWLVRSVNPAAGTAWVGFLDDLAPIDPNRREAVINYIAEHPQQHAATRTVSTRFLTDHCRMVAHWPAGVMIQLGYAPL
ncbi:MAG TPA: TIGR02996 domain-containing protein [Gemmataceae bacterium]